MLHLKRTALPALSLADAAERAGRSVSWVRTHRTFGPLEPVMINGRQGVTADSLDALLAERRRRVPRPARSRLRLAWDSVRPELFAQQD